MRYESEVAVVQASHGRRSFELGIKIGHRSPAHGDERLFELIQIVELEEGPVDIHDPSAWAFAAREPDLVARLVAKLAAITRRVGSRALCGDPEYYGELEEFSTRHMRAYWEGFDARRLRTDADAAWAAKDLAAVVVAYEALSELETVELKRSEEMRLEYARKRV